MLRITLACLMLFAAACKPKAPDSSLPPELGNLVGVRGRDGELGLKNAGYEYRNTKKTVDSSITRWRGKDGGCIEVTTTNGQYARIEVVQPGLCDDDGTAATASGAPGSSRTVCGVIVQGKTTSYICDVEENRQGTTVLRMPDTTLKLTWNLGSNSVQVEQDGTKPVVVKYADAEGETNFRVDERTFFYIANPGMAEYAVKNFKKE